MLKERSKIFSFDPYFLNLFKKMFASSSILFFHRIFFEIVIFTNNSISVATNNFTQNFLLAKLIESSFLLYNSIFLDVIAEKKKKKRKK